MSTVVLGKGSPTLIDLNVASSELRILVTGPRMLYEGLRVLTTLHLLNGAHNRAFRALAGALSLEALCGEYGPVPVPIEVKPRRTGTVIELGVGPMSMYQSELVLRTRSGRHFRDVIREHLVTPGNELSTDYIVALEPLPASGTGHHTDPGTHEEVEDV